MKNKILKLFLLVALFVLCINVSALTSFPDSLTVGKEGVSVTLKNDHSIEIITTTTVGDTHLYPYFHVKNSTQGNIICISGLDVSEPIPDLICKKSDWSQKNSLGAAYLINTIIGPGGSATVAPEKYYWTELLINELIGNFKPDSVFDTHVKSSEVKIAGTGKTYAQLLSAAKTYSNTSTQDSLSANVSSLTFTLNEEDGYYYSNAVEITASSDYELSNLTNTNFEYQQTGNTYVFKIKSSKIKLGEKQSFEITVSTKGIEYYTSARYVCGTGYQDLTLSQTIKNTHKAQPIKIGGSVEKPAVEIKVGKVDSKNKYVAGAKLEFQTEAQNKNGEDGEIITTTNSYNVISNLKEGIYYLTEIEAPEGYVLNSKSLKIEIDSEGNVKVNDKSKTGVITITNNLTKVVINKVSAADQKLLPGATLEIQDEEGKVVKYCKDEDGKSMECRWVSSDEAYEIEGMPSGTYYLVEIVAPEGFVLSEEKVKFIVDGTTDVINVEMKNQLEVKVPDTLSSRSAFLLAMAMFDIALGIGIITYVKKNKIEQ